MAYVSSSLLAEQKKFTLLATSLSLQASEMRPTLRSYSEIRKKLHQTLQSRLAQGLGFRAGKAKRPSPPPYRSRVQWFTPKKKPRPNLRVEATIAPLLARPKTELSLHSTPVTEQLPPLVPEQPAEVEETKIEETEISEIDVKRVKTQRREGMKLARIAGVPRLAGLKEAAKDREWVAKAREALIRDLASAINLSNGLEIIAKLNAEPFKYFIAKGNNSKLVHQLMKARPGWTRVKVMQDANFVWSQRRECDFLNLIPKSAPSDFYQVKSGRISLSCPVKFLPQDSKTALTVNIKPLGYDKITAAESIVRLGPQRACFSHSFRTHNRLEANFHLTNKKALYWNMKRYFAAIGEDYSAYMPVTFHILTGESDGEFQRFVSAFEAQKGEDERNIWIVKPGENSNQGHDIVVCNQLEQIRAELRSSVCPRTGKRRTFVVQKYIEKPFLYCKRKFDIRCYAMVTSVNGVVQGYFYGEGYIRMAGDSSSKEFSLKNIADKYVHLTNDAVQKTSEDYGKFESGNKISYGDFQKYLDTHHPDLQLSFLDDVLPQIKCVVQATFKSSFLRLDPNARCGCFEILGYDFMLDSKLKPVLIEVNTNPCLALVSPLLLRIIPAMLDGALRIAIDPIFADTSGKRRSSDTIPETKWELIFHSYKEGTELLTLLRVSDMLGFFLDTDAAVRDLTDDEDCESDLGN